MKKYCLFMFVILMANTLHAKSTQPMDVLKESVDTIISILNNPEYKDKSKKDIQRKEIWSVVKNIFNFSEMSKRALGKNVKKMTNKEKDEFAGLFARFLGNIYYSKLDQYSNESVKYIETQNPASGKSVVKTMLVTKSNEIPMDYSMLYQKGWKVYDVNIEGVSLVRNYRTQFNSIMRKKGIKGLMAMLEKKMGQFKE